MCPGLDPTASGCPSQAWNSGLLSDRLALLPREEELVSVHLSALCFGVKVGKGSSSKTVQQTCCSGYGGRRHLLRAGDLCKGIDFF